jgi:protein-S-isoprenylcysteine O-methyltransferase Ste14
MSEKEKTLTPRLAIQVFVFIILAPMLPLIISWQWDWWEAWFYALASILGFVISRYLAWRRNPDILAERGKFLQHDNPEPFDKILSPLLALSGGLIPIAAGVDARFGPTVEFGWVIKILSVVLFLTGYIIGSYALIENRFFSGMVRIQEDRDQHVVNTGPYSWVRHPGYSGALITYIALPFLFESLWTFVPVALTFVIIFVRTALEDKTLQEKLEGYRGYAQKVRDRLIPGIW